MHPNAARNARTTVAHRKASTRTPQPQDKPKEGECHVICYQIVAARKLTTWSYTFLLLILPPNCFARRRSRLDRILRIGLCNFSNWWRRSSRVFFLFFVAAPNDGFALLGFTLALSHVYVHDIKCLMSFFSVLCSDTDRTYSALSPTRITIYSLSLTFSLAGVCGRYYSTRDVLSVASISSWQ